MMHFVMRGGGFVCVVSAEDTEGATREVIKMFTRAGRPIVPMKVMEFDPSVVGGVLVLPEEVLE